MLQTLCSTVLNHAVKSNDGYFPRAKVFLSYIYIDISPCSDLSTTLLVRTKPTKAWHGRLLKLLEDTTTPPLSRGNYCLVLQSALALTSWWQSSVSLCTASGILQPLYINGIFMTHNCIQFPCISESENDLLRLCWEGVLTKKKNISGCFPQERYHDDNIMTLSYASTLSPHPAPVKQLFRPPCSHAPRSPLPTASIPPPEKDGISQQLRELSPVSHFINPPWRCLLLSKYYKPWYNQDLLNPAAFSLCAASVSSHPTSWLMQASEGEEFLRLLRSPQSDISKGKQTSEVWVFLLQLGCKSADES